MEEEINPNLEQMVNQCTLAFLLAGQSKFPIKKSDIFKKVGVPKEIKNVMVEKVRNRLKEVFGFDLQELEAKGTYILVNVLQRPAKDDGLDDQSTNVMSDDNPKVALLILILLAIHLADGFLAQSDMIAYLSKLGVDYDEKNHPLFGNVKRLISQVWAQQCYLIFSPILGSDPPEYQLSWGPRAHIEVDIDALKEFTHKLISKGSTMASQIVQDSNDSPEKNGTNEEVVEDSNDSPEKNGTNDELENNMVE